MMKAEGNQRRASAARRAKRATLTAVGALVLLPFLPTESAFQDRSDLARDVFPARFLTEAALRAPAAEAAALAGAESRERLAFEPQPGYGRRVLPAPAASFEPAPRGKSGRVLAAKAPSTLATMLRRPNPIGDERVRTAFAKIAPDVVESVEIASYFKLRSKDEEGAKPASGGGAGPHGEGGVQVASLGPAVEGTAALGYAEPGAGDTASSRASSLFENVLRETPEAFIPPIGEKDHAWAATPLPPETLSAKEQACLAKGIYFEARGEPELGQAAVAQVILNRVRNPAYPKTICGVVFQNKNWRNRCQFSFACDGKPDRIRDFKSYRTAKRIADEVTRGETWLTEVGSSTHYHARYVHPRWANAMELVDRIGTHIFYRTYNGGL